MEIVVYGDECSCPCFIRIFLVMVISPLWEIDAPTLLLCLDTVGTAEPKFNFTCSPIQALWIWSVVLALQGL